VEYRNVVGNESVELVDRAVGGTISIEAPPISTKDFFTIANDSTTGAAQIVHGTTAGNIVTFDAPYCQIISPAYGGSQGIRTLDCGLAMIPSSSGNDEIKITTT
jgi:hypothetical protein